MLTLQIVKVLKIGSSLGVVIPTAILKVLEIERGDQMAFAVYHEGTITLRKLSRDEILQLKPPIIKHE